MGRSNKKLESAITDELISFLESDKMVDKYGPWMSVLSISHYSAGSYNSLDYNVGYKIEHTLDRDFDVIIYMNEGDNIKERVPDVEGVKALFEKALGSS